MHLSGLQGVTVVFCPIYLIIKPFSAEIHKPLLQWHVHHHWLVVLHTSPDIGRATRRYEAADRGGMLDVISLMC